MGGEYSDSHGGLPPTVPPPEWVENVTCYSPLLVDNRDALLDEYVSTFDVFKVRHPMIELISGGLLGLILEA